MNLRWSYQPTVFAKSKVGKANAIEKILSSVNYEEKSQRQPKTINHLN